jgi:hypothetical protein
MDLTLLYLTANRLPERWMQFQQSFLPDYPIVSLSQKPLDLGRNILQDQPPSKWNIFYQMMRGLREIKTPYFAVVEDDTLYPEDHFDHRPDTFAYNAHRWALYVWNPVYHLKNFIRTNAVLIAPTELALETLEKRFEKYPLGSEMPMGMCGELGVYDKDLGITAPKATDFKSETGVIQLDHDFFTVTGHETIERRHKKNYGVIKAFSVPFWGDAEEIVTWMT